MHYIAEDPTGHLLPRISPSVFRFGQFSEGVYDGDTFQIGRSGIPLPDPPISLVSVEQSVDCAEGVRKREGFESCIGLEDLDITPVYVCENTRCWVHC